MIETEPEHQIDPETGLEAWEHTGRGKLYLKKYTGKYGAVEMVLVDGQRTFHITPAERHMNSDSVKKPESDVFTNGVCLPIRLVERTPQADVVAIEANPAILTDEDITALFKGRTDALEERLAQIANPVVMARILEIAKADDKLTASKMRIVQARAEEVEVTGEVDEDGRTIVAGFNELTQPDVYGDGGPRGGNSNAVG